MVKPIAPPKVEAPKKKEEEKKAPVEKKEKEANPLDLLPPTTMVLDDFKNYFVNVPDKKGDGMKYFLEHYDPSGYIIYFAHYEKYTGEGEVLYQTTNLMNGFL
jgi:elongation factor 1-gamma